MVADEVSTGAGNFATDYLYHQECSDGRRKPKCGFSRVAGIVLAILTLQFISMGLNMLLVVVSGGQCFKEFAWGAMLLLTMVMNYLSEQRRTKRDAAPNKQQT